MWSLGQAAQQVTASKSTIQRDIKNGKISATKVEGQYQIEPSELFRVYPKKQAQNQPMGRSRTVRNDVIPPQIDQIQLMVDNGIMKAEIASLRGAAQSLEGQVADLREDRNEWKDQAKTAMRQIEHHKTHSGPSWFSRVLAKLQT